ncbi:S8 family peptidase [Georgenia alba]|uniref:S8 family serine peptidase n=1 Tax=Georgenia alba TaxID=2233858 RepID=A0ABW2Q5P6_9MICO
MDTWSRGRVTLVGDAAYSPGPAVGGGTGLAVVGAFTLAHHLIRHDHVTAYRRTEQAMTGAVRQARKVAPAALRQLVPTGDVAARVAPHVLRLLASLPPTFLRAAFALQGADRVRLDDFVRPPPTARHLRTSSDADGRDRSERAGAARLQGHRGLLEGEPPASKETCMRRALAGAAAAAALTAAVLPTAAMAGNQIGINVVLTSDLTAGQQAELSTFGRINNSHPELDALTMRADEADLDDIRALPYVEAANADVPVTTGPVETSPFEDTLEGIATWNTDQIDVYDQAAAGDPREVAETGEGVYVAVLDTGLLRTWPHYFGTEHVAEELGISFGGGGGERGHVSSQPNKWQRDTNSHGTHVISSILGYNLDGAAVAGVAPQATVIPVKVLNQNGSGWSSVVAAGIDYVTDLKVSGALGDAPVVINMSLGGPAPDAFTQAAVERAVANGVLVVASAGNSGAAGMGYPGAYPEVISVAATGWTGQWTNATWWNTGDVADPTTAQEAYVADFSSRALTGQDLDVAAPGSNVVGPYQTNGQVSYYFLSGTSMAAPHVAGALALMAEANPGLTATEAESALEQSALPIGAGSREVLDGTGAPTTVSWGADATGAGLMNVPAAIELVR